MKIFFTGATGFLGEKLATALLAAGHELVALVRNPEKVDAHLNQNSRFQLVLGDLFSTEVLKKEIAGCDAVFHLAGFISYKNTDRAELEHVNVGGTQSVLGACPKQIPFIFMSSVVAVGAGLDENTLLNEDSPYNLGQLNMGYYETKRKAEQLVREAHERGLVRAIIYNPSSIFGPGDALKSTRNLHLRVAKGEMPYYCRGGVSILHIDDCTRAVLTGFERGLYGERFILSGDNLTILQMNKLIAQISHQSENFHEIPRWLLRFLGRFRDRFLSMTLYHWYDHGKATRALDFHPRSAESAFTGSLGWAKEHGYLS